MEEQSKEQVREFTLTAGGMGAAGYMVAVLALMETPAIIIGLFLAARYGGEEFLLVLNGADLNTAQRVAERVREHVSDQPINLQGLEIKSSISLGVAIARSDEQPDTLLARADRALYAAKGAGRNRVVITGT